MIPMRDYPVLRLCADRDHHNSGEYEWRALVQIILFHLLALALVAALYW
jgi:hypothetical protein